MFSVDNSVFYLPVIQQNEIGFYKKLLENINLMYYESRLFERLFSQNLGQFNTKKKIRQEKKLNLRKFYSILQQIKKC